MVACDGTYCTDFYKDFVNCGGCHIKCDVATGQTCIAGKCMLL